MGQRTGKWDEMTAVSMCSRNGVKVAVHSKVISEAKNSGIRVWGAIDYLVNHCGYSLVRS